MFKFVEEKCFFYTCVILSLIIIGSVFIVNTKDFLLLTTNMITFIVLLGLLFFTSRETKELMKVFLTSLILCTIFSFTQKYNNVLMIVPVNVKNMGLYFDKIRYIYTLFLLSIILIIVCTIYINHCIMNFTNLPSHKAININKILTIMLIILTFADKLGWVFAVKANNQPIFISAGIRFIDTTFLVLTIVSAEALINSKRAAKLEKATTKKIQKKSRKKSKRK